MSRFWITSHDGLVSFQCEAKDVPAAFELLARSLKYATFAELMADTGRGPADFQVARIEVEEVVYDSEGNRRVLAEQKDNAVTNAFKQLLSRRNG